MIIKRQSSKATPIIVGALTLGATGAAIGAVKGAKRGIKKATEEEKKRAAKKRIKENNAKIKANKEDLPKYKAIAEREREKLGPKNSWDDLDRVEMEMWDDVWKDIPKENRRLRKENKELKRGNYESILADDTSTGRKHLKRGAIIGAGTGATLGAVAGHIINKIKK